MVTGRVVPARVLRFGDFRSRLKGRLPPEGRPTRRGSSGQWATFEERLREVCIFSSFGHTCLAAFLSC
jgi:hypothetical protein